MKSLAERRAFFDRYPGLDRRTCPCCGYPTLASRGDFEICYLCSWEDDGQDDRNADAVFGGPNHDYSLTRARENFARYLVKYEPGNDRRLGGKGDTPAEVAEKTKVIAAFDAMAGTSDDERWAVVEAGRRELWRLLEEFVDAWDSGKRD